MRRFVILSSVVVMAAVGAACGGDGGERSSTVVAPSDVSARGGGKPGKPSGGSGSISLVLLTDKNGNGLPNWGDVITFNVSTTATTEPHVDLTCKQNGVVVLGATTGFYQGYPWPWTQIMTLSSPSWPGGAADCAAVLYYFSGRSNTVLATVNFTALE